MELTNENPWKLKGRIKFLSCCDVLVATFGIVYSSYQMFDYYWYIGEKEGVTAIMKEQGHKPFYIFIWFTVVLQYVWVILVAIVLFSAVSVEATETDPHTSIQKCVCWLRTARLNLFMIFVKLCMQPILAYLENSTHFYGVLFGLAELVFKCTAICWILAISISCYVGFQIRQGAELIPGENLTGTEKIARLVVYSTLLYVFLSIQLYMAIQLLKTTKWIIEQPLKSLRKIGVWLEWSFVYLLFISLHGTTALLLMKPGNRKSIIMGISSVQVFFRIVAIMLTTKYQYLLPDPVTSKV